MAQQAQEAGRQVSHAKSGWSSRGVRTAGTEKYNSILYERMNGNGVLTEMENVIFYVSCGVLTEFSQMNVILTYFAMEMATAMATDMVCWKQV